MSNSQNETLVSRKLEKTSTEYSQNEFNRELDTNLHEHYSNCLYHIEYSHFFFDNMDNLAKNLFIYIVLKIQTLGVGKV